MKVSDYLNTGEAGAISMRYLKDILRRSSRSIRLEIEAERRRGVPICSNNTTGYYIAETEEEKSRFVRSLKHRAREIEATAEAVAHAEVE